MDDFVKTVLERLASETTITSLILLLCLVIVWREWVKERREHVSALLKNLEVKQDLLKNYEAHSTVLEKQAEAFDRLTQEVRSGSPR